MLEVSKIKKYLLLSGAISVLLLIVVKVFDAPPRKTNMDQSGFIVKDNSEILQEIIKDHLCPCGCGRFLPGSRHQPACFGCSVGKAEVSHIIESLSAGQTPEEITNELNEPVLVDVFSDYTDEQLPEMWKKVKRLAGEYKQHRVVLRALGLTDEARRAIKLVECARANGVFSKMQGVLIEHSGPWDERTLIDLGIEHGMNEEDLAECLGQVDVAAQISKDREHADMLKVKTLPAVSVNRKQSLPADEDLRKAILKVIIEKSI